MPEKLSRSVIEDIAAKLDKLTPKGKILGNFIMQNPRRAVFMTTKELSKACNVSEATVVRFVSRLGYDGYIDFLQALRDIVDTGLTLPDRIALPGPASPGAELLHRVLLEEMNNIKQIYETVDLEVLASFVERLAGSPSVYVIGSRLSFTFAYYLGWSLYKVRRSVHILKGSDSTVIDELALAGADSLVVIIATSRYPNELIRLGKLTRRLGLTLLVVADSALCPLIQFAHQSLIVPSKSIPFIGHPTAISCIINYLVLALARQPGGDLKKHQERLEQVYLENDVLFNLHH
ncbi:MAG: MurR/RpiR family transcriptional regulator [Desulfobacterales bacterium]|nr:MurR/RpiR family transcriptional regulator [Desulfobacterales bacterium]